MKKLTKILIGLATLALAVVQAGAQDWPTHMASGQRVGFNGSPNLFNPGQGNLRWFRPNASDNVAGTTVIDNEDLLTTFAPAPWQFPPRDKEAFFAYQPDPNSQAPYHYTFTIPSDTSGDPLKPAPGFTLESATWTFSNLGPVGRNYALYVWLPIGPTIDNGVPGTTRFPQRFFVYEITYGANQKWTEVIDTSIAGQGWVRLGAGGRGTNQLFPYDGTNPVRIRLVNTVPRDPNGSLSDSAGTTLVYADAAMAVPEIGFYTASPIASQLTGTLFVSTFAALNERTVAIREGQPTTIEQAVVTSYENDTGLRRWVNIPALENPSLTFNQDNNSAGVTFAPPWTAQNAGANFRGTDFLDSPITNNVLLAANVTYNPGTNLSDGSYDIYAWLPGDSVTRQFGTGITYEIREGLAVTTVTVDQSQPRGWVRIGTRRYNHTNAVDQLSVVVTNYSAVPGDLTREAFADTIRFVGTTNLAVNSTPTFFNARVRMSAGGPLVDKDVVLVAGEDGRISCLDATGRGDGTTDVLWTYPSTPDPDNPSWTDPNQVVGEDGPGGIAQMPTSGFGASSVLVQRINGEDFVFIGARNGRVYCIAMAGRGDMDLNLRKPGTTRRIWSYPNDYPALPVISNLGEFGGSLAYANTAAGPTIFVPAAQGRMIALDAVAGANKTTSVRWQFPALNQQTLGPIETTPAVMNGRVYFGTLARDDVQDPRGQFYSLDAATGASVWMFDGSPASGSARTADDFLSSPAAVPGATLGLGMPDTIFVGNENRFVYALNAATGQVQWQTDELNAPVHAPITYTPLTVLANDTMTLTSFPIVLVPTADGRVEGLFARTADVNRFGGKLAYGFSTAGDLVSTAVASARSWMYITDNVGYLYALNNGVGLIGGQGNPPPGVGNELPPNDASGDIFRGAKIQFVKKAFYQRLRLRDWPKANQDPNLPTYAEATNATNWENRNAFEWGETLYIMVYDFPYQIQDTGGNIVEPPTINFQISVEGQSVRNISQRAKLFRLANENTANSGYAIMAFPLQGGGSNALPPGGGVITFDVTTTALNSTGTQQRISMPRDVRKEFRVANPIGFRVYSLDGASQTYAYTVDPTTFQALSNGVPDDPGTGGLREDRMTTPFGFLAHGQTGASRIDVYDRSMMTVLRGPGRGLENIRFTRHDLEWQGGAGAVYKPIDALLFPLFEELPINYPNTSPDYPNLPREYVKVTRDKNNAPENPIYGPTSLYPPTAIGGGPVIEGDVANRSLVATPFDFELAVPKYQPANGTLYQDSRNNIPASVPAGYYGRGQIFVDSSGNGILDRINGRREAFRSLFLASGVTRDERIVVTTPVVDATSLAPGTGFDPTLPGSATSTFRPWPNDATNQFAVLFKEFQAFNEGNVNELNVRLAKATEFNGTTTPWAVPAPANHELAWLDAGYHVWTNFDYPNGFNLTSTILLQKPRVGDRSGIEFNMNPTRRYNPNTGALEGPLFPGLDQSLAKPKVGVTIPLGAPVGTYIQTMRLVEDENADAALKVDANGQALEPYSDPTFTLTFKVREDRATTSYTPKSYPMIDDLVPGGNTPMFFWKNLSPTGFRNSNGDVALAYASDRPAFTDPLPTAASLNDRFRIYVASLDGQASSANQQRSPLEPLNYFAKPSGTPRFFGQEVGPYPVPSNPSQGQLAPLFLPNAGETVLEDTVKFGSPAFPSNGMISPFSGFAAPSSHMAFVGEAQIQTPSGRTSVSHLFLSVVNFLPNGTINLGPPNVLAVDPQVAKSRPAVLSLGQRATIFYASTGTGQGQLYWNHFNGTTWSGSTAIPLGQGFESITSPSVFGRLYRGLGSITGPRPYVEIAFTGKLRSRSHSEIFFCRLETNGFGLPSNNGLLWLPPIRDRLASRPGGLYETQGLSWDVRSPITLEQSLNGTTTNLEVPGTRRRDSETGLISFDTTLGGKVYLDPSMGTVRFGSAVPSVQAVVYLTYTPRILRVSGGTGAGHGSPSILVDNRLTGNIDYWARPDNTAVQPADQVRPTRFIFTYTRAGSGEGQTARPYMRTARLGAQLDYPIYTNADGSIPPGGLIVTGATSFYQVDPANGRVYFTDRDENRSVTIQYTALDEATGQPFNPGPAQSYTVGLLTEKPEAPIGIEQAVNETQMWTSLDDWDAPSTGRNPGLIWMFWSSTRAGTPDLMFQTIAPRFTPVARRG